MSRMPLLSRGRGSLFLGVLLALTGCSGSSKGASIDPPPSPVILDLRGANGGTTLPDSVVVPGKIPPAAPLDPAIANENARPGTPSWRLTKSAADGPESVISGYALAESVKAGDPVPIAVNVAGTFAWTVYRTGYYGGAGAREIAKSASDETGTVQPSCAPQSGTGLVACNWLPSFTVQTDASWLSGVYLVRLVRTSNPADRRERYVPFFVRPSRGAEVRMVVPTATWQAYNRWGGTSLYDDMVGIMGPARYHAVQVSFDRPYTRDQGAGHLLRHGDLSLVTWLEAQGVDVEYLTDADVDRDPAAFDGARVIVMSGHDEYWSGVYRDRVEAALAKGTSVLNLGANNAYWQIRHQPSSDGRDRRIIVGYKNYALPDPKTGWAGDPVGPTSPQLTTLFRSAPVNRPENALFGVMFNGLFNEFAFPAVVRKPNHWVFEGTGFTLGDVIPFAHGYETDEVVDNGATPAGLEVLAASPALNQMGGVGAGHSVIRWQGNALVFSGGGVGFSSVLAAKYLADPRAQRMIANVLFKMLRRAVPASLVTFPGRAAPTPDALPSTVTTVATGLGTPVALALYPDQRTLAVIDSNGGRVLKLVPGSAPTVLLSGLSFPSGVAVDASGNVYVSDTRNSAVKKIDGASGAVTAMPGAYQFPFGLAISGNGLLVTDGGGSYLLQRIDLSTGVVSTISTNLYIPTGVAVAPDGSLYVSDTGYSRIAKVVNGLGETVVGSVEGFADGVAPGALLLPMYGIVALPDGSLVVSDSGNYRIRHVVGNVMTTLAGSGKAGTRDGAGMDSDIVAPSGMVRAADGKIYVADTGNGSIRTLRF